jgi:hypothetical protein
MLKEIIRVWGIGYYSHVPRAIQPMGRFSAVNGSGVCSTSTTGKQLEGARSNFCTKLAYRAHGSGFVSGNYLSRYEVFRELVADRFCQREA